MKNHSTLTFLLLLFAMPFCLSQSKLTEHTLALDKPENMPAASVEDLAWLSGRWTGEGFGGFLEETWNPPLGGTMVATFRMVSKERQTSFYEICLLAPEKTSVVYKVKHFNPDLTGWEEKDDFISFPLVKIEKDAVYFHGLTLKREGDHCIHYLAMKQKDGSHKEAALTYRREEVVFQNEQTASLLSVEKKIPILFLGSYHMENPGADKFNLEADDVLAPKRQAEIEAVVKKLSTFKPTKVCVEAPFGDSATVARYKEYLAGKRELRRSEEEQIGFRLAKMLGHETIYPIDVQSGMDFGSLEKVVVANPAEHGPRMGELEKKGQEAVAMMGKWLKEGTIADMLYNMNRPDMLDATYQLYLKFFLPTVEESNYAGADLVADWNKRNLRIFSNLHQIGCGPDDRVFVVFGQGHIPVLERIAEDSPYFEVVSVLPYLTP